MRGDSGWPHRGRTKGKGWIGRGTAARRGAAVLILAGAVLAAANPQQRTAAPTSLVFDRVTVIDVEQGKLLPDQRVVIMGNRIGAVGNARTVKLPKGAQVVAAKGKYLIPGLWDMHDHSNANLLFIANGVTGIRLAKGGPPPSDRIPDWERAILTGTRVGPPRRLYGGGPGGSNFVKLYDFDFKGAAELRRRGIPFGGHVNPSVASAVAASDSGSTIIDHVHPLAAGGLDTICLGHRVVITASLERCRPVAQHLARNNTWLVPTLITRLTFANRVSPTNPGPASDIVRDRLLEVSRRFWTTGVLKGGWLHGAVSVGRTDSVRFLSIAQRAGLPILAGADAGEADDSMPPGLSLHAELAIYVTEGLTPLEALRSATLNPAKMLRATDSLGTVTLGKLADLVLLDANPLADITNTTTIRAVVANGRYFDRTALDSLLAEVRLTRKAE